MSLSRHDVWGHFAPMFHLVDVFAIYAMTLLGSRHVIVPSFHPTEALLTIGKPPCTSDGLVCQPLATHLYLYVVGLAIPEQRSTCQAPRTTLRAWLAVSTPHLPGTARHL